LKIVIGESSSLILSVQNSVSFQSGNKYSHSLQHFEAVLQRIQCTVAAYIILHIISGITNVTPLKF